MTRSWRKWGWYWNWRKKLDFYGGYCYNSPREYGGVLKWSKRRDSKSRRPVTGCKGSNPFSSANKNAAYGRLFLLAEEKKGFERAAPVRRLVKKVSGGHF